MSLLSEFYLSSDSDIVKYDLLSISHSSFSQTYNVVRNNTNGLMVTLEDLSVVTFDYYPMKITPKVTNDDLDYKIDIQFGDLGEIIPDELDRIANDNAFDVKPTVIYRAYSSHAVDAPILGPINLEIDSFVFNKDGVSFEAKAPNVNISATGENYSLSRFPMLRGFIY